MPLPSARIRRHATRAAIATLIAVGLTACAEEPPPERYAAEVEAQQEREHRSLKDMWDNATTVHPTPPAARAAYTPPPRQQVETQPLPPAPSLPPAQPRIVAPAPPPVPPPPPKARPAAPDLAISPPPVERPPSLLAPKPLAESDLRQDTLRCGVGADCLAVLRAMIEDPKQSWMMRAPTLTEFSNGTRLFAYRALRKTLECGKLRFAGAEIDWAIDTFSREVDGMDAAHRARVAALAVEVRGELEAEIKQRC